MLGRGDIEGACQRFDASRKLQPAATGPLVNLALCNEQLGRYATAATLYREVIARTREARPERAEYATERLREAMNRVSSLQLVVPDDVRARRARISLDGRLVEESEWSSPILLDGGEHRVDAEAADLEPFHARFVLERERGRATVQVAMTPLATDTRKAGFVVGGFGLVALAVGVGLGVAVAVECGGLFQDVCEGPNQKPTLAERERALDVEQTKGWVSNVAVGAGVLAIAAGTYLVLRSPNRSRTGIAVTPLAQGGAVSFDARF